MKRLNKLLFVTITIVLARCAERQGTPPPTPIDVAHATILQAMSDSAIIIFRETPEDDLIQFHLSLGMWARNYAGLWDTTSTIHKYFDSAGVRHPDIMSGIVLNTLWRKLNGRPQQLDEMLEQARTARQRSETIAMLRTSVCSEDGSSLAVKDIMERSLPFREFKFLAECSKKGHNWVYQADKGFYIPSDSLVSEFESGRWRRDRDGRPSIGVWVPIPDGIVDTTDRD